MIPQAIGRQKKDRRDRLGKQCSHMARQILDQYGTSTDQEAAWLVHFCEQLFAKPPMRAKMQQIITSCMNHCAGKTPAWDHIITELTGHPPTHGPSRAGQIGAWLNSSYAIAEALLIIVATMKVFTQITPKPDFAPYQEEQL
jgi:hypothetical protein